jgi:hypothetical protein
MNSICTGVWRPQGARGRAGMDPRGPEPMLRTWTRSHCVHVWCNTPRGSDMFHQREWTDTSARKRQGQRVQDRGEASLCVRPSPSPRPTHPTREPSSPGCTGTIPRLPPRAVQLPTANVQHDLGCGVRGSVLLACAKEVLKQSRLQQDCQCLVAGAHKQSTTRNHMQPHATTRNQASTRPSTSTHTITGMPV